MAEQPTFEEIIKTPLVLRPGSAEVVVKRDLVYRTDGETKLHADVYLPSLAKDERRPIVIFIHGGPSGGKEQGGPKDWRIFTDYGRLMATSGFVAVTFNHRFYQPSDLARAQEDVTTLIDYVRGHAPELHADADRLFLWAFSGGGPFLSAAFDAKRDYVRAIISYYAFLDVLSPPGSTIAPEVRSRFSPLERLKANGAGPPMFIGRAGKDFEPLNQVLQRFVNAALERNIELELMNHPTGMHGFDILNEDERSRAIIRRTVEFIREHSH